MIHFNLQRVAGLAILLGGALQATLLFLQVTTLTTVLKGQLHSSWNWYTPREYRWIAVSPWLFFLIALLCLYWYVAPQLRWPIWRGAMAILLPIVAVTLPEFAQAFVTDCIPSLPCRLGNGLIPLLLSGLSVVGVVFLSTSLLRLGKALTARPASQAWGFVRFFIFLLALHTCVVAVEVGEWVTGYFKIDIFTMVTGLILAAAWCFIGCMLFGKALLPQERSTADATFT